MCGGSSDFFQEGVTTMKQLLSLIIIAVALASSALLAGCNTVRGVGQDVKQAGNATGNAIEKAADK
jgi:predicted small secreted protein